MSGAKLLPPSLHHLKAHSIFHSNPQGSPSSASDEEWEFIEAPSSSKSLFGQKASKVVLREKDLIVAHGREIRITNLASEGWELKDGIVGSYKVSEGSSCPFNI
jgi:nucleoporin NUP82